MLNASENRSYLYSVFAFCSNPTFLFIFFSSIFFSTFIFSNFLDFFFNFYWAFVSNIFNLVLLICLISQ